MTPTFRRGLAAALTCLATLAPAATSSAAPTPVQRRATSAVADPRNDVGTRGNMQRPTMKVTKASIDISKVKLVSGPRAFTTQVWVGDLQTPQAASGNRNQVFGVSVGGRQFSYSRRSAAARGSLAATDSAGGLDPWTCGSWQTGSDAAGTFVVLSVPYACSVEPGVHMVRAYSGVKGRASNEWFDASPGLSMRVS